MKIKISNLSTMPIYQQIASEIRNKILSNELMSNTQLPSIRALSKELEVGIITIKKAYEVLLQENLIYSKGAVGYFVNEINREEILLIKKEEYFKEIIKELKEEGITILWIHHNLAQVKELADTVTCIKKRMIFSGDPKEELKEDKIMRIFE